MRGAAASARGFTLIELLTVLGILGILLAVGLPPYLGAMQRQRVAHAAQQLAQDIEAARAEVRRTGSCAAVEVNAGTSTSYRIDRYPGATCSGAATTRTFSVPDGTQLTLRSASASVQFLPPYGVNASGLPLDLDLTPTGTTRGLRHLRITGVLGTVILR